MAIRLSGIKHNMQIYILMYQSCRYVLWCDDITKNDTERKVAPSRLSCLEANSKLYLNCVPGKLNKSENLQRFT